MEKTNDLSKSIIFPIGDKVNSKYFIGDAWAKMLVSDNDTDFNCQAYNVTFAPKARNNWHKHPGGQILFVTGGTGYLSGRRKTDPNH
jgi:quercetin dioxygenase-like cupin family protein